MNTNDRQDMNRDPITGAPGSHPLGTGVGAAGGALAGAAIGSMFGPIGTLVGGAAGAIGGGAAGHGVAERVDPTGESDYWRSNYQTRPYYKSNFDYDTDYAPAYSYGSDARSRYVGRKWDGSLEGDLKNGWDKVKSKSRLTWDEAKSAVQDAWDRDDRTYRTYEATDRYHREQFATKDRNPSYDYESDYQPAYRYGTRSRTNHATGEWNDGVEKDLERGWDSAKGTSRMGWQDAKSSVKDAWHGVERALPGDADNDGR